VRVEGGGLEVANALKGCTFASLAEQNLQDWEKNVADKRIHGTTCQQVGKVFAEVERAALLPLPVGRFPFFQEGRRKVNRDGHVEVSKAYYSVPAEYLGREVWARWDGRLVRIFNSRFEQITLHVQCEPGKFSTQDEHIPAAKRSGVERGAAWQLEKISRIGPQAGHWSEQMLHQRGIEGVRVLMGLLRLTKQHSAESIEQACQAASTHGAYSTLAMPRDSCFTDRHPRSSRTGIAQAIVRFRFICSEAWSCNGAGPEYPRIVRRQTLHGN
jgi:hypothetical protein